MKKILFTLLLFISSLVSEELYVYNLESPTNVYTNQTFQVKLKTIILDTDFKEIKTTFSKTNLQILNPDSPWIETNNKNEYINTYEFKVSKNSFRFPSITVNLIDEYDNIFNYKILNSIKINFNDIAVNDKLFSKVIAKDLTLVNQVTKQYNNNLLLTVLQLEAKQSNLEDFYLEGYDDQGIEEFVKLEDTKELYYYIIIPRDQETIFFKYYNTDKKQFESLEVQVEVFEDLVSTQTDLNPQNSKLLFYKKIFTSIAFIAFIILFIIYKHKATLVLSFIMLLILIGLFWPNKVITLDKNTKVYILPMQSSTIFKTLDKQTKVEVIKSTNTFDKIILPNKQIGWIKK
jgi:hypothetical protein